MVCRGLADEGDCDPCPSRMAVCYNYLTSSIGLRLP